MAKKTLVAQPASDPTVAIPGAIRPKTAPVSAASLLSQLQGKVAVKKPEKKDTHPTLAVNADTKTLLRQWVAADIAYGILEDHAKNLKGQLVEPLSDAYWEELWRLGHQPNQSPIVSITREKDNKNVNDIDVLYIVQARLKLELATPEEAVNALVDIAKLTADNAQELINNEVSFAPKLSIRPFLELIEGHWEEKTFIPATDAEQATGQKLLAALMGQPFEAFTQDERDIALINKPNVEVKKDFLSRVCKYCKDAAQLKGVFKVISCVRYPKVSKFGISDTPAEKNLRLAEFVTTVLKAE